MDIGRLEQGRDEEVIERGFAEDWVDGNPAFPDQPRGIARARHFGSAYCTVFPDIQFELRRIIAEGDPVTFRFQAEAMHRANP